MKSNRIPACAAAVVTLAGLTSACSLTQSNDSGSKSQGTGTIDVESSSDACELTGRTAPSGNVVFKVRNTGTEVTEFYLYAKDGLRIVGEIENIGPGLSRDLVVRAQPGTYVTACKPGMKGKGIRSAFRVTGSAKDSAKDSASDSAVERVEGVDQVDLDAATDQYAAYVEDQSQQLVDQTQRFVTLYEAGKDDQARALFPVARGHWERIETVAESFGDLDPKMDLREADLTAGQRWTGWHRIEKDLWPPATGYRPLSLRQRATFADDLLANTQVLHERVEDLHYTVDQIGNGSKGLLDEVASGKITGEEDIWSHTDLWDFQANVDGARVGYEGLRPILEAKDPSLSTQISDGFDHLQKLLDQHKQGQDGFVSYDDVTPAQRKQLSDAVNALAEPLSKMTGAVTL